jgi:DNA (cytosine-5)-methyltransferase 1
MTHKPRIDPMVPPNDNPNYIAPIVAAPVAANARTILHYGSLFSGIEAATLAFELLGWKAEWFAEVDPFCCKVLHRHWPKVPNLGNVNNPALPMLVKPVDLVIGGSPCPSFSPAGKRQGIADPRGQLTLRYCEIINAIKPQWFIWENVPGVLSSNNGKVVIGM